MLDVALKFLLAELNTYLMTRTGSDFGAAQLGRIVDDSGKWAIKEDHVGVALVNIEEERTVKVQVPEPQLVSGRQVLREPVLKVNLLLLFAANFKLYDVGLRYLSLVLTFFQSHPLFTRDRTPGLDPQIERLAADLQSPGFEQLNQMWAFIGGKQLPSALYRVRLVLLQDFEPTQIGPPITQIETTLVGT
jgi:hypothetical protein